jgi:hypothetical protein
MNNTSINAPVSPSDAPKTLWRWIHEERPEPYKDVLLLAVDPLKKGGGYSIMIGSYFEGTGNKLIWMGIDTNAEVLAWMPLPDIPLEVKA